MREEVHTENDIEVDTLGRDSITARDVNISTEEEVMDRLRCWSTTYEKSCMDVKSLVRWIEMDQEGTRSKIEWILQVAIE